MKTLNFENVWRCCDCEDQCLEYSWSGSPFQSSMWRDAQALGNLDPVELRQFETKRRLLTQKFWALPRSELSSGTLPARYCPKIENVCVFFINCGCWWCWWKFYQKSWIIRQRLMIRVCFSKWSETCHCDHCPWPARIPSACQVLELLECCEVLITRSSPKGVAPPLAAACVRVLLLRDPY